MTRRYVGAVMRVLPLLTVQQLQALDREDGNSPIELG